jgi:fructose-specific PTS system IIA-like component
VIIASSLGIQSTINVVDAVDSRVRAAKVFVDGGAGVVASADEPRIARYFERAATRTSAAGRGSRAGAATRDHPRRHATRGRRECDDGRRGRRRRCERRRWRRPAAHRDPVPRSPRRAERGRAVAAYSAVVEAAKGRPVIVRTFDIGGDKIAPYLALARARTTRSSACADCASIPISSSCCTRSFAQSCAASAKGPIKIMAPMVTTPAEAAWFREQVRAVQAELRGGRRSRSTRRSQSAR